MARRTKNEEGADLTEGVEIPMAKPTPAGKPPVKLAEGTGLPAKPQKRPQKSVGVRAANRSVGVEGRRRSVTAIVAAEASTLFPAGGEAFGRWLERHKGIDPLTLRQQEEWEPLLVEFANRPIHGHRRGRNGGNHRINPAHVRR